MYSHHVSVALSRDVIEKTVCVGKQKVMEHYRRGDAHSAEQRPRYNFGNQRRGYQNQKHDGKRDYHYARSHVDEHRHN